MDVKGFLDLFLHLDKQLVQVARDYPTGVYGILFAIVFAETGLVVTPFLPGDSLLFAAGAVGGLGGLKVAWLYPLFLVAALLGDNVNYWAGRFLGRRLFAQNSRFLKRAHLERTEAFFAKHGGKTIILARFVPVVRTFAPFVAGAGAMPYGRFLLFSVAGAILWVGVCVTAGYYFGNLPVVQKNFSVAVIGVVFVSLLPVLVEFINHRRAAAKPAPQGGDR